MPTNALGYRGDPHGFTPAGIQGGIWPAPPQSPNFVQLFISVDDVPAAVQNAEGLGSKGINPSHDTPRRR